jgi:S-DNA-T family DNA segregation ATPase FtsK/SpoIIIE
LIALQARSAGLRVVQLDTQSVIRTGDADPFGPDTVVLIDDCETLIDDPIARAAIRLAEDRSAATRLIVAGRTRELSVAFRGVGPAVARRRIGLLLSPGPGDGDLLGVSLPGSRAPMIPGRGVLAGTGPSVAIQLAMP